MNIDLKKLSGRESGPSGMTDRDRIYMSPDSKAFALAYSIDEWRMGAPAGILAYGVLQGDEAKILGNPPGLMVDLLGRPALHWLNNTQFVYRSVQRLNDRTNTDLRRSFPVCVVDINKGVWVDVKGYVGSLSEYVYESTYEKS